MRTMRWRWWRLIAAARLRRLGGRLVVDAAAAPRLDGPLRLETGPSPGTLTLRIGRAVRIGRDCVLDLAGCARELPASVRAACEAGSLNALMALGHPESAALRRRVSDLLREGQSAGVEDSCLAGQVHKS